MTRLVLLALAKYMNGAGDNCWPSVDTLASDTGTSRRTVCTHLSLAKSLGWLRIETRTGSGQAWRRHQYYPEFPNEGGERDSQPCAQGSERISQPRPKGGEGDSQPSREGGENDASKVGKIMQEGGERFSHEQEREQEREQGKARARPPGLPDSVNDELWSDFVDHRRQIKKPMTSKAVSMLVAKLARMETDGHNAGNALAESIINGWQGVFPPKAGDRTAPPAGRPSRRRVSPSDHEISSYD